MLNEDSPLRKSILSPLSSDVLSLDLSSLTDICFLGGRLTCDCEGGAVLDVLVFWNGMDLFVVAVCIVLCGPA